MRLYQVIGATRPFAPRADPGRVALYDDPVAVEAASAAPASIVEVLLDVPGDRDLARFEEVEEGLEGEPIIGVNYREWLVPAEWLRAHTLRTQVVEDREALLAALAAERRPIPAMRSK